MTLSASARRESEYTSITELSMQRTMRSGTDFIREREVSIRVATSDSERPSRSRSRWKSAAMASARRDLAAVSFTTTNRQGCRLCADGAKVAVFKMRSSEEAGTDSDRKRRTERRERRKPCSSSLTLAVGECVLRQYSVDHPCLASDRSPRLSMILE